MDNLISRLTNFRSIRNLAPVPYIGKSRVANFFQNQATELPMAERVYEAYGSVGTLFAIVNQTTSAVAKTKWHLYKKTAKRDESKREEVLNSGFMQVWNRPNDFYTGRFFRATVQQHLDLVGEGIFVLNSMGGVVYEMWPVRPDRMQPIKHPTKFMTGWIYQGPDGEDIPLELDQVIQIKMPNPSDPYRGLGPVQAMLADVDAARYSAEWNRNFFINGARPGGIIKVDYRMGDTEFEQFVQRWRMQHQGVANAHRVAVLENADWVDTKFSMEDMQFAELRNLPRELIREAFAFPKPMLGTVEDVNRANADAGREIMAEMQTVPRLDMWKDIVDNFLLPRFANGKTLELDYDDPVPPNHDQQNSDRDSKALSARNLVLSGYHPDDVTDAVELPRMRWVGIPSAAPKASDMPDAPDAGEPDNDEMPMPAKGMKKSSNQRMPLIENVDYYWGEKQPELVDA